MQASGSPLVLVADLLTADYAACLLVLNDHVTGVAGFARAGELGIAALSGAGDGQAVRDAARPELIRLAAAGQLKVTVDKVFPLADAADAHRYLQSGHAHGKVVLVP